MTTPRSPLRSRLAWAGLALVGTGFALKVAAGALALPAWTVPVAYFTALAGAAALFVGWVRGRAR